jgi:hypothetical protein
VAHHASIAACKLLDASVLPLTRDIANPHNGTADLFTSHNGSAFVVYYCAFTAPGGVGVTSQGT